jgi:colicin import membrane protein
VRDLLRRNPLAAVLAVLMHAVILAFFVVGVDWRKPPTPVRQNVEVVQARVVDEAQLQAQRDERQRQADAAAAKLREEQARKEAEAKRLAEEKIRKEAETRRLAEEKARKAAEAKRLAEEKARKEAEAKRLAEEKARKAAEAKRLAEEKARKAAEAKRLAEEKAREEAEAKRLAEEKARKDAEAKRVAAEKARREAEAKAREQELAAQMQATQDQAEVARVVAAIRDKVERNWLRPPGTAALGLKCRVRVRLGANGTVLLVNVIESSGNGAFDRSVESAVRKADPLPMPDTERLKAQFRELTFEFDPA